MSPEGPKLFPLLFPPLLVRVGDGVGVAVNRRFVVDSIICGAAYTVESLPVSFVSITV